MHRVPFMDFSRESGLEERLLKRIKAECFGALSDEDLELVSAAGVTAPADEKPGIIKAILFQEQD